MREITKPEAIVNESDSSVLGTATRRGFLGIIAGIAGTIATPAAAELVVPRAKPRFVLPEPRPQWTTVIRPSRVERAAPAVQTAKAKGKEQRLHLVHVHTGETFREVYRIGDWYNPDALNKARHFMRDWRADAEKRIEPELLDALYHLQTRLQMDKPFEILGGYRSPQTNAEMRRHRRGVAKDSYHMKGFAVDLMVPDRSLRSARNEAVAMKAGGVGYYPRSNFIHIDVGPVRTWGA